MHPESAVMMKVMKGKVYKKEQFPVGTTFALSSTKQHSTAKIMFEKLAAHPWRLLPVIVDIFINRIKVPGAKHAFESAFRNSTSTQIKLSRFKVKKIKVKEPVGSKNFFNFNATQIIFNQLFSLCSKDAILAFTRINQVVRGCIPN